jgi:hypothetical protein
MMAETILLDRLKYTKIDKYDTRLVGVEKAVCMKLSIYRLTKDKSLKILSAPIELGNRAF